MHRLKSILLLFSLFIVCESSAQCPMGNVFLMTQAQVDAFPLTYPGCTDLPFNLNISSNNITNLNGLSGLTSVGGDLEIETNLMLTNVDGLSGLISVGGDLTVISNSQLTNVNGLGNLTSVGGDLNFQANLQLTNVDGLSNLTSVGGFFILVPMTS